MKNFLKTILNNRRGASGIEYAVMAAIMLSVVSFGGNVLGDDIQRKFETVGDDVKNSETGRPGYRNYDNHEDD